MIQVRGLNKVFPSGPKAIDNLDLYVGEGEIFALLGPNGAGKTTTIRVLSTLSGFDSGEVKVAGYNVDTEPEKVRAAIGIVAQNTGIDYFLTGRENLMLQGHLYRMKKSDIQQRIKELADYFELADSLDRQVATYSGGMRRKLDIATALIHRPKLIFLDEPTLGLDIKSRKMLWRYVEKLNKEMGLTILLTTHYLEEADKLAQLVAIISGGKIRALGTPDELKNSISGDALTLSFEQKDDVSKQFGAALLDTDYIKDSMWKGNKLHLYVASGVDSIPKITALASDMGARILTLSLSRPTLDDVFLKYTGASMEDSGEDAGGDEWWKQWAGKGGGGKWATQWSEGGGEGAEAGAGETQEGGWGNWSGEDSGNWQGNQWTGNQQSSAEGKQGNSGASSSGWGNNTAWSGQQEWSGGQGQSDQSGQESWQGNQRHTGSGKKD